MSTTPTARHSGNDRWTSLITLSSDIASFPRASLYAGPGKTIAALAPPWPVSITIKDWTSYTKADIIGCKGPGE